VHSYTVEIYSVSKLVLRFWPHATVKVSRKVQNAVLANAFKVPAALAIVPYSCWKGREGR
jgi:hypothetical protein